MPRAVLVSLDSKFGDTALFNIQPLEELSALLKELGDSLPSLRFESDKFKGLIDN